MRKYSRFSILAVGVVALVTFPIVGCAGAPERPNPVAIVTGYLNAIAEGDATTAAELDAAAVRKDYGLDASSPAQIDVMRLRTDAVLQGAEEHIEKIQVKPVAKTVQGADDTFEVGFTYSLDGQEHSSVLTVRWDAAASTWVLEDSLTVQLFVDAQKSSVQIQTVPFNIGGVQETIVPEAENLPYAYLVYPGVYRITADIPENLLAPGVETVQLVSADSSGDASAIFKVLELPQL